MGPIRQNPCLVNWTIPLCDFTHPKTVIAIGGQSFKCLLDTGADRTVLKKEEVPSHWELVPGPHVSGVGGTSKAQETASYLPWVGPEGERGRIRPLVVQGLAPCPRCKKGYHWKRDCQSKYDINGRPLN